MELTTFLLQALNGVQYGMLLFLLASGLTLTFGIMGVLNLAHGALFMLGAYLAYHFTTLAGWPLAAALPAAIAGVVALGLVIEWFFLAPLAKRDHLDQLLVTYGLILILDEVAVIAWGKDVRPAEAPAALSGQIDFGLFTYPAYRFFVVAAGAASAVALWALITRTRLGMIVRAGSFDRDMVRALGISVKPVFGAVFGIGAALAALAGIVAAPILSVSPGMGDRIIIVAFVVVVIGGIGSIKGALFGALLVGLVDAFGKSLVPSLSSVMIYLLMAAVLIWKPEGLFGRPTR